jgi:hypothetical protein
VQYRFVREDLPDAEMCRVVAAMPLARRLRDTRAALMAHAAPPEESSEDARRDARALAATLARLARSARALLGGDPAAYALDPETRAWLAREVDACASESSSTRGRAGDDDDANAFIHGVSLGSVAARDALAEDERATRSQALLDAMAEEGASGAHRIGAVAARSRAASGSARDVVITDEDKAPVCAVVHERGRPRWGPARATVEEAVADRKAMRAAIKAGALDEWLRRLRPPAEASRER